MSWMTFVGRKLISPFFVVITLTSCLMQNPTTLRKTNSLGTQDNTVNVSTPVPPDTNSDDLYWFGSNINTGLNITINENIQSVIYIRGKKVESFLNLNDNFDQAYCLTTTFNLGTLSAVKQLRVKAVPIVFTNFSTGQKERLFRIDLYEKMVNETLCNGTVDSVASSPAGQVAYSVEDICPDCSYLYSSQKINLYQSQLNSNNTTYSISDSSILSTTLLDPTILSLRIDPDSLSSDPTGLCTQASCQAKGYDCCSGNGQCIKNGAVKPGATSHSDYNQALADIAVSPANFIYWPEIFYICPGVPLPTPTPTGAPDVEATAQAELDDLINSYFCLQGAEQDNPSYTSCLPNRDFTSYSNVKDAVWLMCECATLGTPAPEDPANTCPQYGLLAYDQNKKLLEDLTDTTLDRLKIASVACLFPEVVQPTPLQKLDLKIPTRSVPHRFFKASDGVVVPDILKISGTPENVTFISEGTPFAYDDEVGKVEPQNGDFNMNSILGQMRVDLSAALPAVTVNVELDQVYVIRTIAGTYTPCPTCSRDGWFSAFTPFPPSQFGTGLQATGFTTKRDTFMDNFMGGNYEDTLFGRACFVPPTMIPFSHRAATTVQEQRQRRLNTQAALYVNGYKRDWYGFNYGAVIGSFDGVTWFAVGKNRKVVATTNKLMLAINAPFGDLAQDGELSLQIIQDTGDSYVPTADYDPTLAAGDGLQNEGASCQKYHQCEKDTDCIAQLGWEYMCADISNYRTLLPRFNINGEELANQARASSFAQMIYGGEIKGTSKRCVYRGAGAICKQDYFSSSDPRMTKLLTCAPNFYCADIGSAQFNKEISRTPQEVEQLSILIGQGAPVLGRPKRYLQAGSSLTTEISENILSNASLKRIDNIGLCRPGKKIALTGNEINPGNQHSDRDPVRRADYINQIASCDSKATNLFRVHSCPIVNESTGNYYYVSDSDGILKTDSQKTTAEYHTLAKTQNACGAESLSSNQVSPFSAVEADPLLSLFNLVEPSVARDACLRRAGSICHTDLDCSPNILHANQVNLFGADYFGGTEAERKYWQENLICGQALEAPFINSQDALEKEILKVFDVKNNRCCREIGKTLTMYTENDPESDSETLITSRLSVENPQALNRYSRYGILERLTSTEPISMNSSAVPVAPKISQTVNARPARFQWKTFHDTGRKTCCGGGWIRKFADGTHDWTVSNRIKFNVQNFNCINFRNPLYDKDNFPLGRPPLLTATDESLEEMPDFYCRDPRRRGCALYDILAADGFTIVPPTLIIPTSSASNVAEYNKSFTIAEKDRVAKLLYTDNTKTAVIARLHSEMRKGFLFDLVPYGPRATTLKESGYTVDTSGAPRATFMDSFQKVMAFYLPSYINSSKNIHKVFFTRRANAANDQGNFEHDIPLTSSSAVAMKAGGTCKESDFVTDRTTQDNDNIRYWCVDPDEGIMYVRRSYCDYTSGAGCNDSQKIFGPVPGANSTESYNNARFGVMIEFYPMGTRGHYYDNLTTPGTLLGMTPGNDYYYLKKFEKFELLGIPQIYYEPIYCSSNKDQLVEGIYSASSRSEFENNNYSFALSAAEDTQVAVDTTANPSRRVIMQKDKSGEDTLVLDPVFSSSEFICCNKLGDVVSDVNNCCSGFGELQNNKFICKLPNRTNLNLYFNRFVSGEGVLGDKPNIDLTGINLGGGNGNNSGGNNSGGSGGSVKFTSMDGSSLSTKNSVTVGDNTLEDPLGLVDADFDPQTGYPKNDVEVYAKLIEMGEKYCIGKRVFEGAAFGTLGLKPRPGRGTFPYDRQTEVPRSLVSDFEDIQIPTGTNTSNLRGVKGFTRFNEGRRWNHHLYCGEEP